MEEFVLLIQGDGNYEFTEDEIREREKKYREWMDALLEKGQYVWGQPLKPEGIHFKNVKNMVTDGPFLEPKEMVGGIIIFKARDKEEASAIAASCPLLTEFPMFLRPVSNKM